MSARIHSNISRNFILTGVVGLGLALGCGAKSEKVGGETNWLASCSADEQCSNSQCLCGVCSRHCDEQSDCSEVGESLCVTEGEDRAECKGAKFVSACLPTENTGPTSTTEGSTDASSTGTSSIDPEAGIPSRFELELPEGGQGFEGEITFEYDCGEGPLFSPTLPFQVFLTPRGDVAEGRGWGLSATGDMAEFALDPAQRELSGTNLWAQSGLGLSEFRFSDLESEGDAISGKLESTRVRQVFGDIIANCDATGTVSLTKDVTAPTVSYSSSNVVGFSPLSVILSEPVRADFDFGIDGPAFEFTRGHRAVGTDFISRFTIFPTTPWPSGALTLTLGPLQDGSGLKTTQVSVPLQVPDYPSATSNPSFEEPLSESGPWFGSCKIEAEGRVEGQLEDLIIPPTDGDSLLSCWWSQAVLQAYIEPPSGSVSVSFDVGESGPNDLGPRRLSIWLRYPDREQEMVLVAEGGIPTGPELNTYRAELDSDEPFWLVVDYTGVLVVEGDPTPQGQVFADNLRFE